MKLLIQIPCYNEARTLETALNDLPKKLNGIDEIEYLIVNDGSLDDTVEVARRWGVHHIVSFRQNKGLAKGFVAGLDGCLRNGADIIVNTDADNQYCAADIQKLIEPILEGRADMVIGARPIDDMAHFSTVKKKLQHFGSWVVRRASSTDIPDAPSGFRAFSREAAMRINVVNDRAALQNGRTLHAEIDGRRREFPFQLLFQLHPVRFLLRFPVGNHRLLIGRRLLLLLPGSLRNRLTDVFQILNAEIILHPVDLGDI